MTPLAHFEHPEDEPIRTFLSIQFRGCFRIGRTLEVSAVRDEGVSFFKPKRAREIAKKVRGLQTAQAAGGQHQRVGHRARRPSRGWSESGACARALAVAEGALTPQLGTTLNDQQKLLARAEEHADDFEAERMRQESKANTIVRLALERKAAVVCLSEIWNPSEAPIAKLANAGLTGVWARRTNDWGAQYPNAAPAAPAAAAATSPPVVVDDTSPPPDPTCARGGGTAILAFAPWRVIRVPCAPSPVERTVVKLVPRVCNRTNARSPSPRCMSRRPVSPI